MKRILGSILLVLVGASSVYAGETANCSVDGLSVSYNSDANITAYESADFIYSSPCPPVGITTTGVCLTTAERDAVKAIPSKYRKCIDIEPDGTWDAIVEMSQAEKDVVDAPEISAAMEQAAYATEIASNDLCDATLQEVGDRIDAARASLQTTIDNAKANIQSSIDGSNNLTQAKAAMTTMNNTYATGFGMLADDLVTVTKKLGRCVKARAGRGF